MSDKVGLLDERIEIDREAVSRPLIKNRALVKPKGKGQEKFVSDFSKHYPTFSRLMLEDEEVRVRMHQALAWSKFAINLLALSRAPTATREFFTQSETHRLLFHVLLNFMLQNMCYPESEDPTTFGAHVDTCVEHMLMCGEWQERKCRASISAGIEAGRIKKSTWRYDARQTVLWLNPADLTDYLTLTMTLVARGEEGLPQARRSLLAARKKNSNFEADVEAKLRNALEADGNR